PLGALPEVQVRDQQARRTTVLQLEVLAAEPKCDPCLPVEEILQRQIRRVPAKGVNERKRRIVGDAVQQRIERHAFPHRVELRPPSTAWDIRGTVFRGKRPNGRPLPPPQHVLAVINRELPLLERNMRSRTGRKHRKSLRDVLTWRQWPFWRAASTDKSS